MDEVEVGVLARPMAASSGCDCAPSFVGRKRSSRRFVGRKSSSRQQDGKVIKIYFNEDKTHLSLKGSKFW